MTAARFLIFLFLTLGACLPALASDPAADFIMQIPSRGWNMNFDPGATWLDDAIYLPGEFDVHKLPIHRPTGGWRALERLFGPHRFMLPATVEEAYWGEGNIYQSYTPNEYYYAKTDTQVQNGAFYGVSWWWRDVEVPATFTTKPVYLLKIRGARQRAEVFVNYQLCGYSMLAETAFTSDVSAAIRPGQTNRIIVRITNPGGRFDWNDGYQVTWGKYKFQESHGFGGLDTGITLEAHDRSYVSDSWVLNGLNGYTIDAHAELTNTSPQAVSGIVHFSIIDPLTGAVLATESVPASVPGAAQNTLPTPPSPASLRTEPIGFPIEHAPTPTGAPTLHEKARPIPKAASEFPTTTPPLKATEQPMIPAPVLPTSTVQAHFSVPKAKLWTLDNPNLYQLKTEWIATTCSDTDQASRTFGFRSFKALGIGQDAGLYLNDVRIRLYTAISWGFWGIDGLWPKDQMAAREVISAKQLGLNCLNFHRNIGREAVLDEQDQHGLLRYLEPGGGAQVLGDNFKNETESTKGPIDTSSKPELFSPANSTFAQRYEQKKILAMIRQFRSHPSVIIYNLQNEMEPNLHDPRLFTILREMHQEDPSRIIVAKSGIEPIDQVFFNPASLTPDQPKFDDGTGYSGWHDQHTVGGPGVWTDDLYRDPEHFTHNINDRREIVDWGEMLGSPSPDNHDLMLRQLQPQGKHGSYDFADHKALNLAYSIFLDKWNFRTAFPTNDAFYRDAGTKTYQFWGRVLETARLCESSDIFTISGWESTSIEDHSGLVDNLRNCKADPSLISDKLAPLLPVIEPRGTIFKLGEAVTTDLLLLNETGHAVSGKIVASYLDPAGQVHSLGEWPAPSYVQNTFVYPVKAGVLTEALTSPGKYVLQVSLQAADNTELAHNSVEVAAYSTAAPEPVMPCHIGYLGSTTDTKKILAQWSNLNMEPWDSSKHFDLIIDPTEPNPQESLSSVVLKQVSAGTPLLILAGDAGAADRAVQSLAQVGGLTYKGTIPSSRAPWMGNWVFVRDHPTFAGLPVNEVMKGDYQLPLATCYGLKVDGKGVEVVVGYGRDHDRDLGAALFTCKVGQGTVLLQTLTGMNSIMYDHWLINTIAWLQGTAQGEAK